VVMGNQVYLKLEGLIDRQVEFDRLTKEIGRVRGLVTGTEKRLGNEQFTSRAPKEVVDKEREKYESLKLSLEKLEKSLAALQG